MKNMFTKILAGLLSVCAILSFGACGDGEGSNKVKMINVPLSAESYGVAVAKGNTALLQTVNTVLAEKATEITAMIEEYENKNYENDTPTDNTYVQGVVTYSNATQGDNYLVMATDAPFAPWEYTVGENWGGIDIEIGKMIADKLDKTLAVKQTAFDTICMAVNNGDADIGLAGLTITPAREQTVNFSNPYYEEAYQVLVVKEDDTRFNDCTTTEQIVAKLKAISSGTKVGSQTGTTGAKYIVGDKNDPDGFGFDGFSNLTLKPYDTHADAVRDMVNGQVSLCIVDNLVAAQIVAQINAAA